MRYVIIGNSIAATGVVEGIRQIDQEGEITLISGESHPVYSRPLISYLLAGKKTEATMRYRAADFYQSTRSRVLYGRLAVRIDPNAQQIDLDDGQRLVYDRLCVATGSVPFIPRVEGLETVADRFTFMSLDDARRLEQTLSPDRRVLIIGAGLIGLKCAEGIRQRVRSVTVVDLAPAILSSILDQEGARLMQTHLEKNGLEFHLGTSVRSFEQNHAILENGERIGFDLLVMAVGVRCNTALLSGIAEIGRGITVNERAETSARHVYAAGDCTQTLDVSSGITRPMPLLPNAYMQGECAGINMAGGGRSFNQAIPMNAIGFFGLHVLTAGCYDGMVYREDQDGRYKRLFYNDQTLNGFILIGQIEKAGIYTSLIRERTPLAEIDFSLICENPGLMAFKQEQRQQKLGGIGS